MTEVAAIRLEGIAHTYGAEPILNDVNLAVGTGEFVAIMGASGAGKSSVLRAIAGLIQPQSGQIHIGSRCVFDSGVSLIPTEQRGVGMMFQDFALFPHLTVSENIMFGIHRSPDRFHRRDELLQLVNLAEMADRYPDSLSGGQQQRVALARALAPKPKVLLLDEPFANLDVSLKAELSMEIRRILKAAGAAALLVSHDRDECLGLADRIAILGPDGSSGCTIIQRGSPSDVYKQPKTREAAHLTGPVTFIEGVAIDQNVDTQLGPISIAPGHDGPVILAVRPHEFAFEPTDDGCCTVTDVRYLAPGYVFVVDSPIGSVNVPSAGPITGIGVRGRLCLTSEPAVIRRT